MSDAQPDDDGEEMDQINVEVPARTKALAMDRLEYGEMTRRIREMFKQVAHGENVSRRQRVKDHLQDLRDERQEVKHERQMLNNRLEEIEREIERAEDELDAIRDRDGQYEGALETLGGIITDGQHVFKGHAQVRRAAEMGNCTQENVIADLKERHPDAPAEQFQPATGEI